MMNARPAQLAATEKRVEDLSQQFADKYNVFVSKLESTNMDHCRRRVRSGWKQKEIKQKKQHLVWDAIWKEPGISLDFKKGWN